jgi:hypothetical protein
VNVLPRPGAAVDGDRAAALGHDAERDRQAEPGAGARRLGREERLEDARAARSASMPTPVSAIATAT